MLSHSALFYNAYIISQIGLLIGHLTAYQKSQFIDNECSLKKSGIQKFVLRLAKQTDSCRRHLLPPQQVLPICRMHSQICCISLESLIFRQLTFSNALLLSLLEKLILLYYRQFQEMQTNSVEDTLSLKWDLNSILTKIACYVIQYLQITRLETLGFEIPFCVLV